MTCPVCGARMRLVTQYVGSDGKIVRVYECPECQSVVHD